MAFKKVVVAKKEVGQASYHYTRFSFNSPLLGKYLPGLLTCQYPASLSAAS